MTTVGVNAYKPERVDAFRFESYNYNYPAFKQKQLCDFYKCYRHRPPPDYRRTCVERMRQACQCHKDMISHDRAGLRGDVDDFFSEKHSVFPQPAIPARQHPDLLIRPRISLKEYSKWRFDTTPVVTTHVRTEWNNFLNRCPERFDIQLPVTVSGNGTQLYYDGGYGLRYLRPHLSKGLGMERCHERLLEEIQGPATYSPFRDTIVASPFLSYGGDGY